MENPNNFESTIIGNCLSCQGLVRVPAKAPASSKVRCPHCTKSFLLSQILDQAIPELELIDEEPAPTVETDLLVDSNGASKDEEGRFVVPSQLRSKPRSRKSRSTEKGRTRSKNSRSRGRTRSSGAGKVERQEFNFEREANVPEQGNAATNEFAVASVEDEVRRSAPDNGRRNSRSNRSGREERNSRRSNRRPRSQNQGYGKNSNPALEVFKVILGGLLAVPIAYLLVLWVFGQDPLQVGPTIGKSVPFVVPAKFRDLEVDEEAERNAGTSRSNSDQESESNSDGNEADIVDVSDVDPLDLSGLPKPNLDPNKVGNN